MIPAISIKSQIDAVRLSIEQMDISMADTLLDHRKYQNFDKADFLRRLLSVFDLFKNSGDSFLVAIEGRCNSCDPSTQGFTFVGNNSLNYISLIFLTDNHRITDIYECSSFKNLLKKLTLAENFKIDDLPF